jgi:F0F1-type ATP synthase assembly protein I
MKYAEYSQIAFALPAGALAGWLIGGWLDRQFGTGFLSIVLLLVGVAGGIIHLIRFAQRVRD